jgi:hypothetical protein
LKAQSLPTIAPQLRPVLGSPGGTFTAWRQSGRALISKQSIPVGRLAGTSIPRA